VAPAQVETAAVTLPVTLQGLFYCPDVELRELEGSGTATVFLEWSSAWSSGLVVGSRVEFGGGHTASDAPAD